MARLDTVRSSVTMPQTSIFDVVELVITFMTVHRLFVRLVSPRFSWEVGVGTAGYQARSARLVRAEEATATATASAAGSDGAGQSVYPYSCGGRVFR